MILVRPILTEKTYREVKDKNAYTFKVSGSTNKIEIAKEVKGKFNVDVESVKIINQIGKAKNFGAKRQAGFRKSYKKAIVTLKKGQKIDLFDMK